MTYEEVLQRNKDMGFNTYKVEVVCFGHPFDAALRLDNYKLKRRKVLRVEEVEEILQSIYVNIYFKHSVSGERIKLDSIPLEVYEKTKQRGKNV